MSARDPRLTPARPDLAAESLRGEIPAPRYAAPRRMVVRAYAASVRRAPRRDAPLDTEALHGEAVDVYDMDDEGWAWGQLLVDGYVGYLPADDLIAAGAAPTHRVVAPRTFIYPVPDIKAPPLGALPLAASVTGVAAAAGAEAMAKSAVAGAAAARFVRLAQGNTQGNAQEGGYVYAAHLALQTTQAGGDHASVAEKLVGAPYLWGGRSSLGLDCSALVQLSLLTVGKTCPRDSDMQAAEVGAALPAEALEALTRGDLVFWRGHVGMMLDQRTLVHANGHHMQVAIEPLAAAIARIADAGGGPVTALRAVS